MSNLADSNNPVPLASIESASFREEPSVNTPSLNSTSKDMLSSNEPSGGESKPDGQEMRVYSHDHSTVYLVEEAYILPTSGYLKYAPLLSRSSRNAKKGIRLYVCEIEFNGGNGACPQGAQCQYVHMKMYGPMDPHMSVRESEVHRNATGVVYKRLPSGMSLEVYGPNRLTSQKKVSSEDIFETKGVRAYYDAVIAGEKPTMQLQECAHFNRNGMCYLGAGCSFVHIENTVPTGSVNSNSSASFAAKSGSGFKEMEWSLSQPLNEGSTVRDLCQPAQLGTQPSLQSIPSFSLGHSSEIGVDSLRARGILPQPQRDSLVSTDSGPLSRRVSSNAPPTNTNEATPAKKMSLPSMGPHPVMPQQVAMMPQPMMVAGQQPPAYFTQAGQQFVPMQQQPMYFQAPVGGGNGGMAMVPQPQAQQIMYANVNGMIVPVVMAGQQPQQPIQFMQAMPTAGVTPQFQQVAPQQQQPRPRQ